MSGSKRKHKVDAKEEAKLRRLGRLVSDLRSDTMFADVDVCVGDETIPVHRSVVCGLCDFFLKAFSGPFKEAERRSVKINMHLPRR